jgi:putative peptidoglycan lipid II flippase
LLWSLFFLLSFITGLIGLFTFIFAPQIVSYFAPNYLSQPEKFEVTVVLTKIMSPFLLCVSLAALFMGALNSLKVFFIPSLAPTFFNIASILSMIGFPAYLSSLGYQPVYALGIGVMIGGVAQALVMVPLLFKYQYQPLWPKKILTEKSKKVFKALKKLNFTKNQAFTHKLNISRINMMYEMLLRDLGTLDVCKENYSFSSP